jgi:curved DNA-binding protein CbpA
MDLDSLSQEDLGRSLRLCVGSDPTALRLSAAEGYLLSRIDGHTPWRVLREIGGLSPEDVDICVEGWIADGLIEMISSPQTPKRPPQPKPKAERKSGEVDESELDESLDISIDVQRRILEFESGLDRGYSGILGVSSSASAKDIKRAYRELSREFHPDRYFRKEIGAFAQRLEEIFKKVLEGYELLSDPATRAEVQKAEAMNASPCGSRPAEEAEAAPAQPEPSAPLAPLTPIERLRQRMPFKLPESVINERRHRARSFYDAALMWAENGHPLEAASSIRLAIAFDPHEDLFKKTFAEIQASLAEGLAKDLLKEAGAWSDSADVGRGLKRCEEALLYRPHDPELNDTAAQLALRAGDPAAARDYIDRALEHSPEVGRFRRTLGQVLHANGDVGHGIRELGRALELDSSDGEAQALLAKWKAKPRRAVSGGNG